MFGTTPRKAYGAETAFNVPCLQGIHLSLLLLLRPKHMRRYCPMIKSPYETVSTTQPGVSWKLSIGGELRNEKHFFGTIDMV
jgi:hypothetical protein